MAPPRQLGARIRWLFLIFILFNVVTAVPRTLHGDIAAPAWKFAAVAAAAGLAWWWLRGYRRNSFPAWAAPVEGLALAVIGYGSHNWLVTLGLLFVTVSFRGLYGSWKNALALTVSMFAGSLGAILLTEPHQMANFLQQTAGVPPLALFTAAVAESTRRQEQAAARERVFARLGSTLVTTSDEETIRRHAVEAARELLGDLPGNWAAISADRPDGVSEVRVTLALDSGKRCYGSLLVGADVPIPAHVRPSLETLAAQTVLGLRNAEHAEDLRHQAFHDNLTGLANRPLLRDHLTQALARARRGSPVAVLLIDLDGFKAVNDTYGHGAGDQLLVAVAQRLRDGIRGADTGARLGGDEFAVLLDGMDSPDDAALVAERLLVSIQQPLVVAGVQLVPAASIGVAVWRGHPDIDSLLHDADTAMYAAKTAGKGRVGHLGEQGDVRILIPS
ncbi:GGDEF domain-containing protein [Actinoplanes aureus]|uniref:GGDEF domain-containing protein n=1 Tax=Actinoplanes aureus TaxID=2792083 RepID=A0A931G5Q5_9ACTN|nr:GGDEF domain-containing protein [Actinoplanes aureus]MBG0566474.1 GGDEF domain-containing protein [Actinoplanes aureus]